VQGPDFKPQYQERKKERKEGRKKGRKEENIFFLLFITSWFRPWIVFSLNGRKFLFS
jgi:hypothetical protein